MARKVGDCWPNARRRCRKTTSETGEQWSIYSDIEVLGRAGIGTSANPACLVMERCGVPQLNKPRHDERVKKKGKTETGRHWLKQAPIISNQQYGSRPNLTCTKYV